MFILDKPYVSDLMKETIEKNGYKVLNSEILSEVGFTQKSSVISTEEMVDSYKKRNLLYSNSENSIEWVMSNLNSSEIAENINLFKNKYRFRNLVKTLYPDFFFKEVKIDEIDSSELENIKKPFIIKPTVGFLSIGVYTVFNNEDLKNAITSIKKSIKENQSLFPKEVIDTSSFIIEEYIEGAEYAFDAYYNENGEPVIINILHHIFSSKEDVSDRLYMTSKKIIEENIYKFQEFLEKIGELQNLKNFPMHVEVRVKDGNVMPIEINPMRFAGWCTTDIAYYAYKINPYEYFMEQKKPKWSEIFKENNSIYSLIVLDAPKDIELDKVEMFDYDLIISKFEKVINLRKIDIKRYPIFGFIFTETREENYKELEEIVKDNLKEYIK